MPPISAPNPTQTTASIFVVVHEARQSRLHTPLSTIPVNDASLACSGQRLS
jgi:hypothetical protein